MPRTPARGRAVGVLLVMVVAGAGLLAWWLQADPAGGDHPAAAIAPGAPTLPAAGSTTHADMPPRPGPPLSAQGRAEQAEQRAQWQARLERARHTLDAYLAAAQYPHESRPIAEHPDQQRPFEPIAEERALSMPGGGSAAQGVRLRTTQERVFASGLESSRITLTLTDDNGRALPLRVQRAVLKEVTPPGQTARSAEVALDVNDAGRQGDALAGDGTLTALMQPGAQGFGSFAGTVRLEMNLEHAGQPGFIYFDLIYTPEVAGSWLPGVRELSSPAGLNFFVKAQLLLPGRYVVTGRIDDAAGKPVALAQFNGDVGAGEVEFRLPVFGKLLRDSKPAFPLVLRDVEAFLLKPDAFPDRVMLPRRAGVLHRSREYALASFSAAEWASEERTRHVTEFSKDVAEAEQKLRQLGP